MLRIMRNLQLLMENPYLVSLLSVYLLLLAAVVSIAMGWV